MLAAVVMTRFDLSDVGRSSAPIPSFRSPNTRIYSQYKGVGDLPILGNFTKQTLSLSKWDFHLGQQLLETKNNECDMGFSRKGDERRSVILYPLTLLDVALALSVFQFTP